MRAVAPDRRVQRPAELRRDRGGPGNAGREHRPHPGTVPRETTCPAAGATGLESGMNGSNDSAGPDAQGVDDVDLGILDEIEGLYTAADPPPADLVERVRFALALEEINAEVLRLQEEIAPVAARGDESGRIITFSNASLSVMIRVVEVTDDTVRVDGWLAPPAAHRVTARLEQGRLEVTADDQGRFVFEQMPSGMTQFIVRIADQRPDAGNALATQAVVL